VTEIHNISYVASPFIPRSCLHPLNKRPLLDKDGELPLGFKADHYQALFSR
jgi:hypothetical protein